MKRWLVILGILLAPTAHAAVLGLPDRPAGFVTDQAQLLTEDQRTALESRLQAFAASTSIEIAVVTVPSLQGGEINDAAVKLFEAWGIGGREKDTGALFLVAKEDRQARIEVGYGLEGALTDSQSGQILRQQVFPAFKEERYGDGILAGVEAMERVTQGEALPQEEQPSGSADWLPVAFFGTFFLFQALVAVMRSSKSWWLGGVLGGGTGLLVTALHLFGIGTLVGLILTALLTVAGLALDYVVSRMPIKPGSGRGPWIGPWGGGGFGGSSGGGFGGFGGGRSGGGGASGGW